MSTLGKSPQFGIYQRMDAITGTSDSSYTLNINNIPLIKYNPKLTKDILKFFYHNLANSFNFKKNGKFGAPTKIGWKLNDSESIIMNFTDQSEFYKYIVSRHWNQTNFGFLVQVIKKYLDELNYGLYLINNKHCGGKYYYRLGINITNDKQFRNFIANFV